MLTNAQAALHAAATLHNGSVHRFNLDSVKNTAGVLKTWLDAQETTTEGDPHGNHH